MSRTHSRPRCAECDGRIRSHSLRVPDPDLGEPYCYGCIARIRDDDLTPGDDFEAGELWNDSQRVTAEGGSE